MGVYWDSLRIVVSLRGSPERLLELVRRSTDAVYFSAMQHSVVCWAGTEDASWSVVRPGGAELFAASTAALPAKDAQLAEAIAAHYAELHGEEDGSGEDTEFRKMGHESLCFHLQELTETVAGAALRKLYAADHALLLTWFECGYRFDKGDHCNFGFDNDTLGFHIEAYELGGDTLRFSFNRHGWSTCFDGRPSPYAAVAALFADLDCAVVIQPHYGYADFDLAVIQDGVLGYIHIFYDLNCEEEEEKDGRRNELLRNASVDADWLAHLAALNSDAPHIYFCFADFCAQGAAYMPDIRTVLRAFDAYGNAEERLCVHRNHFKHAGAVIMRAYRRAMTDPAYAMCRRRLNKLFDNEN